MSIVFRLALTAFLFPLCGCAYDFGDQAEQFVKNEAYAWSKKMLVADLTVRWPNFFRAWVTQLAVDLDKLSQTTANMSIIAPPTSDDDAEKKAVLALVWIDKTKRLTLRNQEKVARIIDSFSLLNNICSDPVAFDGFGL
ncbi:MAG: hypothetical protein QOE96_1611 [Blastocatellia bacterium]|jgi:hypothetical protein|nr:hypothetical protein [Blastocatellia bacterium]